MTPDNPLGIMYFAHDRAGRPGLGFAAFENQSPVSSHGSEWSEILSEILGKGQTPVLMRCCPQSDFLDAIKSVPK